MANRSSIRLTYEDYCEIPSDGKRYQLVHGELFMAPAPSPRHQRTVGAIFAALRQHVQEHGLGKVFVAPVDVLLDDGTVPEMDVVRIYRRDGGAFLTPVGLAADRGDGLTSPLFPGLTIPPRPLFATA